MDDDWVDEAVAGIDANLDRLVYRGVGDNKLDGDVTLADIPGAPTISGTGRPDLKTCFSYRHRTMRLFSKCWRIRLSYQRLNWMIGPGYRVTQNTALCHVKGRAGRCCTRGTPTRPASASTTR